MHVQFHLGCYGFGMVAEMHSTIFDPGIYLAYQLSHDQFNCLVSNGTLGVRMLGSIMKNLLDCGLKMGCVIGVCSVVKCTVSLGPNHNDILPTELSDFGIKIDSIDVLCFDGLNPGIVKLSTEQLCQANTHLVLMNPEVDTLVLLFWLSEFV